MDAREVAGRWLYEKFTDPAVANSMTEGWENASEWVRNWYRDLAAEQFAALSAAGMTICGEQVVFDKSIGGYTDTDGKPITVTRGVFVPLSDPQEGDT